MAKKSQKIAVQEVTFRNSDLQLAEHVLWTDGSCLKNPGGPGSWACILRQGDKTIQEMNGTDSSTTNNRMEMMAAIQGLRLLTPGSSVVVVTDSQLMVLCAIGHWGRKKNRDLWRHIDEMAAKLQIHWRWIKGHNGSEWNERCDELCRLVSERTGSASKLDREYRGIVAGCPF